MGVKLLTEHHLEFLSFKGSSSGPSESTLVKMSNCWKSRVTTPILLSVKQVRDTEIGIPYKLLHVLVKYFQ